MKRVRYLRRTGVAPVSIFRKLLQRWVPVRGHGGPFQKDVCGKIRDRRDACPTMSLRSASRLPFWLAGLFLSLTHLLAADITTITVHADKPGAQINPAMWGIFFEDINFGADGGLYAELVKNGSFEFPEAMMGWNKAHLRGVGDL